MDDIGEYSASTYYRRFGSWNDAVTEAGLDINRPSPSDLKKQRRVDVTCAVCETEFTVTRSKFDSQDQFCCSRACEHKRRETAYAGEGNPRWRPIEVECYVCGATKTKAKWDAERYDRHYCDDCWGAAPTVAITCEWCGGEKKVRYAERGQRFCSYECMGEWRASTQVGEDHPRWAGGYEGYYGPNWPGQRRRARKRDGYTCQECGTHEDDLDQQLEVHHIEPFRAFTDGESIDYEAANDDSNLVSLCPPCHLKVEWRSNRAARSH